MDSGERTRNPKRKINAMADKENLEKVMLLTANYRILGAMRRGPDGSLWDFKHRAGEDFITVYDAQCFRLTDGVRMYDAGEVEVSKRALVAVFKQKDCAFIRKEK